MNSRIYFLVLILSFIAPASFSQTRGIQFRVNFDEFANLTYHLDCLSDQIFCHREDFAALWEKEFLKDEADKKLLADWKTVRARYQRSYELETGTKFPLLPQVNQVSVSNKLTIAGLQSKNLDDYLSRLDLLVIPAERLRFEKVIRHFEPRFAKWWADVADVKGKAFAGKITELLALPSLKNDLDKIQKFYGPGFSDGYIVTFDLIYRPDLVKGGSSGFCLENRLPVEFFFDEDPKRRIDVLVHEFGHFMLYSMPPEKYSALQAMFVKSGRPGAVPAFNLLDEALASAVGNGVIARSFIPAGRWEKYLVTAGSFYNNPNVDKAGKTLLPLIDEWLANGGELADERFVTRYLAALETTFGETLTSPQLYLSQSTLFIASRFDSSLVNDYRRALNVASLYRSSGDLKTVPLDDFNKNPNLNALFIVGPDGIDALAERKIISKKDRDAISKIYTTEKNVLYVVKRNDLTYVFVMVAETADAARQSIKKLAAMPTIQTGNLAMKDT